jgi:hypothetical protein
MVAIEILIAWRSFIKHRSIFLLSQVCLFVCCCLSLLSSSVSIKVVVVAVGLLRNFWCAVQIVEADYATLISLSFLGARMNRCTLHRVLGVAKFKTLRNTPKKQIRIVPWIESSGSPSPAHFLSQSDSLVNSGRVLKESQTADRANRWAMRFENCPSRKRTKMIHDEQFFSP